MGAGKKRRQQRAAREQIDTTGHLYDGCPTCEALASGDEGAALAAMFRHPQPDDEEEHRIVWWGDDEGTYISLIGHGHEWVAPVTDEQPVQEWEMCPACTKWVPTWASMAPGS